MVYSADPSGIRRLSRRWACESLSLRLKQAAKELASKARASLMGQPQGDATKRYWPKYRESRRRRGWPIRLGRSPNGVS
jgi:hypothetical protein